VIALAMSLAIAETARAHVRIQPSTAAPGQYATLVFWVYHGCDDAPTVRFSIQVPDGVAEVTPQVKPGWEITTRRTTYPEPVTIYGRTVTEGAVEITWTGGPIPATYMDSFVVTGFLPNRPGDTLRFVTVQECQDHGEPQELAPELALAAAEQPGADPDPPTAATGDRTTLVIACLGLVIAAAALAVALRRR
jgi:uncharacterized protein YcnI